MKNNQTHESTNTRTNNMMREHTQHTDETSTGVTHAHFALPELPHKRGVEWDAALERRQRALLPPLGKPFTPQQLLCRFYKHHTPEVCTDRQQSLVCSMIIPWSFKT